MDTQSNWPMILGIGAIALSAMAAGLAAGPYLQGHPRGADGSGGMTVPDAGDADAADPPSADSGAASAAGEASEEERLRDLLVDIIDEFGGLKRRVDRLESGTGGDGGLTRHDPDTGQEYRAVTVWVPEGMADPASQFLRDAVLQKLSGFSEGQFVMDAAGALQRAGGDTAPDGDAGLLLVRSFGPLVTQFAAAWNGREPAEVRRFQDLLLTHGVPYARVVARHNAGLDRNAARLTTLTVAPPAGSEPRPAYDRMRAALRTDWSAFVAELPFDVKDRYLGWCSDFLKSE